MHADHPLGRDPYESSLFQWLFNGGAYYSVPTPHARILRDLGLSLLVTGVWLENHLPLSIFIVEVSWPGDSTPYLDVAPSSATLTREPKETPSCPATLSNGPYLRGPTTLTLVNARGRAPVGTFFIEDYLLTKICNTEVCIFVPCAPCVRNT